MSVIWLAAALAAETPTITLGLGPDLAALRGTARHDVAIGFRTWATYSPRPWSVTFEGHGTPRADRTDLYAYSTVSFGASALFEGVLAPHATAFRAGLGPAFVGRGAFLDAGQVRAVDYRLEGGVRVRLALDGPLYRSLAWAWHSGSTIHPSGTDWDVGLGLGVAL